MENMLPRSSLRSFWSSASSDWGSAERGCQHYLPPAFIGEDWLVLLTGHFPRVNGSFWSCSSVVGGKLSPVRLNMVNGCWMVKTPGIAWEVFPESCQLPFALRVRKIKCREKCVQFRSIWSGFLLCLFILWEREWFKDTLLSLYPAKKQGCC